MTETGAFDNRKPGHRPIRSFVLRQGRLTPAQARALESLWSKYGIDWQAELFDWNAAFGRDADLVVELGFGNGDALAQMAAAEPEKNFIGIEVHPPGVGSVLQKIEQQQLENVRVISVDGIDVLESMVADGCLSELRLYFADPWPKKRHHKRRIVQTAFLDLLARKLRSGGRLHMATDWQPYAEHMLETCEAHSEFRNLAAENSYIECPDWRPETHFERRGLRLGHGVWDLLYQRR